MYEIFEKLCQQHNVTPYRVCKETGLTTATISNWKAGRYVPKTAKLQKIADFFGVSVEYLMTGEEPKQNLALELNKKDLRDIKKSVDSIMESLDSHNGESLYYDGVEVELTDENKELLRSALNIVMQAVKMENKEKYNPHKNGK